MNIYSRVLVMEGVIVLYYTKQSCISSIVKSIVQILELVLAF